MRLVVARVGRAHGIRGEVTVEVRTDRPGDRLVPGAVLHVVPPSAARGRGQASSGQLPRQLTVAGARDHNGTLLLTFDEIVGRDAADRLRDVLLEVEVAEEPAEPDAWYDHELVGLRVVDPGGADLGSVVAVEHPPAQDLLVVARPDGVERLVPLVAAIVPVVDVAGGVVVVDAPAGLLDDPEA